MIATLDPIWSEALQRRVYRALLMVHGFPGDLQELSGLSNGSTAALAVLATLLDGSTTWADADGVIGSADRVLLSARQVAENEADFVVARGENSPRSDFRPRQGELLHPERAATVILVSNRSLLAEEGGVELELSGPGIPGTRRTRWGGVDARWFAKHAEWNQAFPLGVDLILADRARIAALPRTTRVRVCGS